MSSSMKRRSMSRTFRVDFERDAAAPGCFSVLCSLFDMRLLVFSFTAVSGPQLIKADKPRSIIYAVIVHEVYFALAEARSDRITRSAYPEVLTSAITFRCSELAPGTQPRLAAQSVPQAC